MMRRLGTLILLLVWGCAPMTVSDECRRRIDDCIRSCPARQTTEFSGEYRGLSDTRSECERRCHREACYP
jgi:hypothetical protein